MKASAAEPRAPHSTAGILKIFIVTCETSRISSTTAETRRKRCRQDEHQQGKAQNSILKSDMQNQTRSTQQRVGNVEHQKERNHCRVSKDAGVTACLIDPGEKVSCLLRRFMVDFRSAESAYVCGRVDGLLAVRTLEDIEIAWTDRR